MDHIVDRSPYCRTCRRALNLYTPPDAQEGPVMLLHAIEARGDVVDHRPDPVPLCELADPIIDCDFCSGQATRVYLFPDLETHVDQVTRRYVRRADYQLRHRAARTVRTETTPGITNRWGRRWTSCDDCAAYVDAGDKWGLITRVVEAMPRNRTRGKRMQQMRGRLEGFYSGLFATGPQRRGRITPQHPHGIWDNDASTDTAEGDSR